MSEVSVEEVKRWEAALRRSDRFGPEAILFLKQIVPSWLAQHEALQKPDSGEPK